MVFLLVRSLLASAKPHKIFFTTLQVLQWTKLRGTYVQSLVIGSNKWRPDITLHNPGLLYNGLTCQAGSQHGLKLCPI